MFAACWCLFDLLGNGFNMFDLIEFHQTIAKVTLIVKRIDFIILV